MTADHIVDPADLLGGADGRFFMLLSLIAAKVHAMSLFTAEHSYAPETPRAQTTDLLRLRDTLIAVVLEARTACEAGPNRVHLQVFLSAAVKDVEDVDEQLYSLCGVTN
ncbi:hypothetical protein IWX65_002924 [Arthrobacter sp. CAN_A214]|uniref:hypothetical protein n=1 Tax=Arthrobacter sp. CAN_A214 TaxID=2787720 RepID=UPI0018CB640E